MTCASCYYSAHKHGESRLWCLKYQGPALRRCPAFDYAPGTDEGEK